MTVPVDDLARAVGTAFSHPLITVGSGGSFTAAQFGSAVHRQYTSGFAAAMTPLEAVFSPTMLRSSSVMLLTAGGKNPDVLGAFRRLVAREPRRLIVLCMRTGSPLADLASSYSIVDFNELDVPSGKDGFLATNSLLVSAVVIARAYAVASASALNLPETFPDLLGSKVALDPVHALDLQCRPLWERPTLVALYGPSTHAAALDLESKFAEAALGPVLMADYRNFAHGRHHWLARRGEETGVLAFVSDDDRELAETTLKLLPPHVPVARLAIPHRDVIATLAALAQVFIVVGSAGRARGIDPGDPGIPAFGRRIYHMRTFGAREDAAADVPAGEAAAIERKSGVSVTSLITQSRLDAWRAAYRTFVARLSSANFCGMVLDYDGTLCEEAHRFEPLTPAVGRHLSRFLTAGVVLGVATGRGKSVKTALREAVAEDLWGRVVIGYYNGGDIGLLSENDHPDGTEAVDAALEPVADALRADPRLERLARFTFRRPQITIEPAPETQADHLWALVQHVLYTVAPPGVAAVRSSHSMDVVAPGVGKRAVVDRVLQLVGGEAAGPVLCMGDRGLWPGNDFSLLSGPYSLSVDEVSPDPGSCWNLAEPGRRGMQVALDYLEHLEPVGAGLRLSFD